MPSCDTLIALDAKHNLEFLPPILPPSNIAEIEHLLLGVVERFDLPHGHTEGIAEINHAAKLFLQPRLSCHIHNAHANIKLGGVFQQTPLQHAVRNGIPA